MKGPGTTPSANEGGNLHEWWRWPGAGTSTVRPPVYHSTEPYNTLEHHMVSDLPVASTEFPVTSELWVTSALPSLYGLYEPGGAVNQASSPALVPAVYVSGSGNGRLTERVQEDLWHHPPAGDISLQALNVSQHVFNSSSDAAFWGLPGLSSSAGSSPVPLAAPLLALLALAILTSVVSNGLVLASIARYGRRGQPCLSAHLSQTAAGLVCSLAGAPLLLGSAPAAALATAALTHASPALASAVLLSAARRWCRRPLVGALVATWLLAGASLLVVLATAGLRALPPLPLLVALSPLLLTCYGAGLTSALAAGLLARLPSRWVEPQPELVSRWPPTVAVLPPSAPPAGEAEKQTFQDGATRRHHSAVSGVRWSVDVERSELDARRESAPEAEEVSLPNLVLEPPEDGYGRPARQYSTRIATGTEPEPDGEAAAGCPEPATRMVRSDTFPIISGDVSGAPSPSRAPSPGTHSVETVAAAVSLSVPDLSRRPTTVSELSAGSLLPPPAAAHDGYLGDHSTPPSGAPTPLKQRRQRTRRARDQRCTREPLVSPRSWPVTPAPRPVRRRRPLLGRSAARRLTATGTGQPDRQGALLCLLTTLMYGAPGALVLALVCRPASAQHLVAAYLLAVQWSAAVGSLVQALADLSVRRLVWRTVSCDR